MPLNPRVFDGKHGTVLDSGTTYAYLPEAAFVAFKDSVRFMFLKFYLYCVQFLSLIDTKDN